jgi:hypothetical protein
LTQKKHWMTHKVPLFSTSKKKEKRKVWSR